MYEIESDAPYGFFAHGDHRPEDFVDQVNREYGEAFDPEEVWTSYTRIVPLPHHHNVDNQVLFNQKKGRGAFFATYVLYD